MTRLVMPRKVRIVWPWLVIRSMPRNACVIQITPVRLTKTSANDASVVRKIYLSIDPIANRTVPSWHAFAAVGGQSRMGSPLAAPPYSGWHHSLTTIPLIRQQNGWAMAALGYG
jgi:hypothetical protein